MPNITKEYYHNIDLLANQLLNSRLHNITTAARILLGNSLTVQDKGYQVYDTDLATTFYWSGYVWGTTPAYWGNITGTLSNQTDLQNALNAKFDDPTGTISDYIRGDGSIAAFPTIPTVVPSALTKTDDTNVTLTLGGTPTTALLQAVSLTLGWTGTLADSRIASASTWNAKQNAISLTTTGTSGPATFISNVLNIPQYTDQYTGTVTSVSAGTGMSFTTITTSGSVNIDSTKVPYYSSGFLAGLAKWDGSVWTWDTNNYLTSAVTSVGLSVPPAFTVTNSPVTGIGTLSFAGAGIASQYVRGDGTLATFPTSGGGGSSVNYYLNGSINQGTFSGNTYYQLSRNAITTTPGTDFTIAANGIIARFITDAGDPGLLAIPGGNWNLEFFFSSSSSGGSPSFYVNVYKYNGGFTLIGTSSTAPEAITNGTTIDSYYTSVTIPTTSLSITDRIAIEVYVNHSGRTITMHTEDNHVSEVITTFSTGLNALNGLTAQVQYFGTGTTGTDFNINSTGSTHTFNLPVASDTNTGKLSNTDYTTFTNKASKGFAVAMAAAL